MPFIEYVSKKLGRSALAIVENANEIIDEYGRQGYDLTLRQLYYQFVSRDLLPNNDRSYKRLGNIISDARRAGLIDWSAIVDRTRYIRRPSQWESPAELVMACSQQFDVDWWATQLCRVEVWIEKDALVGVLETACGPWHCPYFSCRGYVSDSEIWSSAQRIADTQRDGQKTIVLHLGDHDPSGIDMSRDIEDRLRMFSGVDDDGLEVRRIALTMKQIDEVSPPPNPAKSTDARFNGYQAVYGDESWELDALDPTYLGNLIALHMKKIISQKPWKAAEKLRDEGRLALLDVANTL